jgi:hypothetical protein
MSSIIREGDAYHGIGVFGRGVYANDEWGGRTYAGQCRGGHACGLGVLTWSNGTKVYAEHGPDGQFDGPCLYRWAGGNTFYYLYERGKPKESARVDADGDCMYNAEVCAPDDPRLLALIAQVAPVEVRPAARNPPKPSSRHLFTTRRRAIVRWIGRLVLPPQALAAAVATEVHPHAARRRWHPCATTQLPPHCKALQSTAKHDLAVARARAFLRYWSHGPGSVVAIPSPSTPPAERCHSL